MRSCRPGNKHKKSRDVAEDRWNFILITEATSLNMPIDYIVEITDAQLLTRHFSNASLGIGLLSK